MWSVFLLAEDENGFERAAPVRTLVQKHAGESMFLARGRIHEKADASVTGTVDFSGGTSVPPVCYKLGLLYLGFAYSVSNIWRLLSQRSGFVLHCLHLLPTMK